MTAEAGVQVPGYLTKLAERAAALGEEHMSRWAPPDEGGRHSAVLILLADTDGQPDVLLIEKATKLRAHSGQPAFPGGAAESGDADLSATALREAAEEVGVNPSSVTVLAILPVLYLPPSGYIVTPVLGFWHTPGPVGVNDPGEIASVARVRIADLVDPTNRFQIRHPSGYIGPAFSVAGMVVWGFTAGLLSMLLELGDWAQPWDRHDVRALDIAANLPGRS